MIRDWVENHESRITHHEWEQVELLLRTPWDGPWLSFQNPSAVITACEPGDVRRCLDEAERASRDGFYAAGFVTYEAAAAFGLPVHAPVPGGLPLACFGIFPRENVHRTAAVEFHGDGFADWTASIDRDEYACAFRRIKEHIASGDTYQLNFTFRLRAPFDGDARALFADLVAAQRGAWSAYVDLGTHAICSASPELFFSLNGGRVECRPMKGTMPRGLTSAADVLQADRLHTSAKNRSENVMIVDLIRNDLGRIARVGSVIVDSLFDVERYPRHWQMTSTVTADVDDTGLAEIFAALFPSGSVTGAPKQRSMEIIRALEPAPRGMYTGAIGMIDPLGRSHFNVAIRSVTIDRTRQQAEFGVGSGIVWESIERNEYDECQIKAAILTTREPAFRLLETLKWEAESGFVLLDRHLDRLHQSADYFAFRGPIVDVRATLERALSGRARAAKVRVLFAQDGEVECEVLDLGPVLESPLRVALAASPVSAGDVFLYHKTTQRAVYERARASRPDVDAVLLWNEDGEMTEGTETNLVVELDGRRVTPPVECGLLAGTMRAELLARGEIAEERVPKAALARATRMWLINSVRGWMEAELVS